MEMTMKLVLLLGLLGCHGLPEVEISSGKRQYKGYQVQATIRPQREGKDTAPYI